MLGTLAVALPWFVAHQLHYFTDYSLASYGEYFWPRRAGLILRLTGGARAILVGLVQIRLGLTDRVNTLHRMLGKVYGAGILIGGLGGFYLAPADSEPREASRETIKGRPQVAETSAH